MSRLLGHAVDKHKYLNACVDRLTFLTFCAASSRASATSTRCCTPVPLSLISWRPRFHPTSSRY